MVTTRNLSAENGSTTFRYFWREVAWERRRIIPALDLACVKAPFSDGEQGAHAKDTPEVEHMWLSEVDFDGQGFNWIDCNDSENSVVSLIRRPRERLELTTRRPGRKPRPR